MKSNEKQIQKYCWLILLVSTILKLIYVIQVKYNVTPHDIGILQDYNPHGYYHSDYILYIATFHKLPDFSPIGFGEYYHPPLFYGLSAIVVKVLSRFSLDVFAAFEVLQFLNMLVACVTCIVLYKVCKKLGIEGKRLFLATLFFSFCPCFYNLGAALNNDCLMTFFSVCAVYFTICWIESSTYKNILGIALSIALGMLSKTSAVLLAPAIAAVFLYVWIKNRKEWKTYFWQFVVFGCVSIPLGMFWVVREKIRFDIPFNYVLELEGDIQYVGDYSLWTRLGFPSLRQLFTYKINWTDIKSYANVWGQTFFTMVFDEGIFRIYSKLSLPYAVSRILLWGTMLLCLAALIALVRLAFKKQVNVEWKLLLLIGFFVLMGSYISFAFQYPQVCTMNFRYIVLTLVFGICALYLVEHGPKMEKILEILVVMVSVASGFLFLFCGV